MKYLDALLRLFEDNEYTHREDVAIIISEIFEKNPDISLEDFTKKIKKIRRDFFRINRLNRNLFAQTAYLCLNKIRKERPDEISKFNTAKQFISKHFEIGFDSTEFVEERNNILESFSAVKKPHETLMRAFNKLLEKIQLNYKVNLHGVKEYSGIDISQSIKNVIIGFQIKSRNDDISEHMIRSETSKAQDWKLHGFVLIYGRESDKKVEPSIQAAYHHFKILNESKRLCCAIVYPELLAELFRTHSISLDECL
jgi:hypothetical protein